MRQKLTDLLKLLRDRFPHPTARAAIYFCEEKQTLALAVPVGKLFQTFYFEDGDLEKEPEVLIDSLSAIIDAESTPAV